MASEAAEYTAPTPQQQVLRDIVLHNHLLPEPQLDGLLNQLHEPRAVIEEMSTKHLVDESTAEKLMHRYERVLQKRHVETAEAPHQAKPWQKWHSEHEVITRLLRTARAMKASDVYVMANVIPTLRIGSILRDLEAPTLNAEEVDRALRSILLPAQYEHFQKTNDLDCAFSGGPDVGRFRVNVLRELRGPAAVFRLIPDKVPTFDELALPDQLRQFTRYRQGMVLVTGPKGSGKTTTLAAIIDLINTDRAEHIITIEDPIEFVQPSKKCHVNQREIGIHTHSFANALRASLREAPDVIMVGEMRDLETISLAITAAETGHLVFGTLHTPDCQRTINRVIDVFPPEEQAQIRSMFSESLRGVVSQHLLPGIDGKSLHLATEIMFNTTGIANLIRDNRAFQIHGQMQTHYKMGMHLMDDSLIGLVKEGKVAREEALARADNVGFVERETARYAAPEPAPEKSQHE